MSFAFKCTRCGGSENVAGSHICKQCDGGVEGSFLYSSGGCPSFTHHLVLLKIRKDCDVAHLFGELAGLQRSIPGLLSFKCGPNESGEGLSRGFNYAFTMVFESKSALELYLPHPEHERVKQLVLQCLEPGESSVCVFDFSSSIA